MRASFVNSKYIFTQGKRFEGKFYLNDNSFLSMQIERHSDDCLILGDIARVFNPPIFKRQFCKNTERAVPYFQSSDIPNSAERSSVYVFKGQAESLNLLVQKGDVLVTGFGTIGNTRIVSQYQDGACYANNVCRIRANDGVKSGFLYAFLTSKYGYAQLNKNASGSVVRYIESPGIKRTLIPDFPSDFQKQIDDLIQESARLREEAQSALDETRTILVTKSGIPLMTEDDYNYFGPRSNKREVSCFTRNISEIGTLSFHAFNYSERLANFKKNIKCPTLQLSEVIEKGDFFSTGSFPRVEQKPGHGIKLINQSDVFDTIIKGKYISRRGVKTNNLVEYGEVMIAGVGTLGEGEKFCRTIFANEDLEGQLVSGEFIRMKTNSSMPSGYLYTWLNSEYGFRLIRFTQAGTKQCRPIQKLLLQQPVPIIDSRYMLEIDEMVRKAHTMRHEANVLEEKAITLVEEEIEKWNK